MADQKNNKQLKKIPAAAKPKEKLNHVHKRHTSVTQLSKEEQPDDDKSGYKVAAKKSMKDILNTDKDDKSLNTYKKALMGTGKKAKFPNDPRKVIIKTFAITKPGKKAIVLKIYDPNLAKTPYSMVEKEKFQVKLTFYVQHDVCLGLKYMYFVYKHGVRVEKKTIMIGSFAPKVEPYEFAFPVDETPSGFMARGKYKGKSRLVDDDKNIHHTWEYAFKITKK